MPGLAGIVWNTKTDELLLDRMASSIKHEEWHRVDKYTSPFFSAAKVSLGIFNPEPQPIFNEDSTICIFMYGKIYDYEREMRELESRGHKFTIYNDAEFCLHSYEEYGKGFVNSLNGSFVLAIYDLKRRKLIIVNDRYGFRPLYYAKSSGKLLFASEVKAILEDSVVNKELDDEAIADFFAFGEILGNKTFFKGIKVLPPASVFTYDGKDISIDEYWNFNYKPDYGISQDEMVVKLVQTFKKAVGIRMRGNLRYGVALSGGLDSRVIAAAIPNNQQHSVIAFTYGIPDCNDIKIARLVAEKTGLNHLVMELDADELISYAEEVVYLSDGMDLISVAYLPYAFGLIRDQIDVFSFATALDLLLGGSYLNQRILNAKTDEDLLKYYLKRRILSDIMLSRLFTPDYYRKIERLPANSMKQAFERIRAEHPANRSDYFYLRNHVRRFTILGSVIPRNKVEESIPTFDNEFMEVILKIPPELRFGHRIYRKFLTKLAPELAAIPYNLTMVNADAPLIVWRIGHMYQGGKGRFKKMIRHMTKDKIRLPDRRGYVNFDEWLRLNKKWREYTRHLLLDEHACSRRYLNRDYIRTLINQHEAGRMDYSTVLTHTMTFEIFLRLFS
jgi:asparagine synthase (glutamine-hydrolysing)